MGMKRDELLSFLRSLKTPIGGPTVMCDMGLEFRVASVEGAAWHLGTYLNRWPALGPFSITHAELEVLRGGFFPVTVEGQTPSGTSLDYLRLRVLEMCDFMSLSEEKTRDFMKRLVACILDAALLPGKEYYVFLAATQMDLPRFFDSAEALATYFQSCQDLEQWEAMTTAALEEWKDFVDELDGFAVEPLCAYDEG